MAQEDKNILLEYLCMALPYGLVIETPRGKDYLYKIYIYSQPEGIAYINEEGFQTEECKPYLRQMSSMTKEEKRHISKMMCLRTYDNGVVYDMTYPVYTPYYVIEDCLSYLRSIHVDYLGLIEKGLAIKVTKENNPYEHNKF